MVVSCHKCRKQLSTQQALDYHLRNVKCDVPHPSENDHTKKCTKNYYDLTFTCNFYGTIINITDDSKIIIDEQYDLYNGMDIYHFIDKKDHLVFLKSHLDCIKLNTNTVIHIRLSRFEDNNPLYVSCSLYYDESECLVINCHCIHINKPNSLFFILDNNGQVEYVNDNVVSLLGWDRSDFIGKEYVQYLSDLDMKSFCNMLYTLNTCKYTKKNSMSVVTKQGYYKKICTDATLHNNLIFISARH